MTKQLSQRRRAGIRQWFDKAEISQAMPDIAHDVVDDICTRMVDHGETLHQICKKKTVPEAPALATLMRWREADERIEAALKAARTAQAEARWMAIEEEVNSILDEAMGEVTAEMEPDEVKMVLAGRKDRLARAKIQIDVMMRVRDREVSKLVPQIYGSLQEKMAAAGLDKATRREMMDIEARLAKIVQEGVLVQERVLEVPATVAPPADLPRIHMGGVAAQASRTADRAAPAGPPDLNPETANVSPVRALQKGDT